MVKLTLATEMGVPLCAQCSICGRAWVKPEGDPDGSTFIEWCPNHLRLRRAHRPSEFDTIPA